MFAEERRRRWSLTGRDSETARAAEAMILLKDNSLPLLTVSFKLGKCARELLLIGYHARSPRAA
jgi:hypothetical protein